MRRPASLLPLTVLASVALAAADGTVAPRFVGEDTAGALFHDEWRLPVLRVPESRRKAPRRVDLAAAMRELAALHFPLEDGERELAWSHCFGDIVRGLREAHGDPARRARMLDILPGPPRQPASKSRAPLRGVRRDAPHDRGARAGVHRPRGHVALTRLLRSHTSGGVPATTAVSP